MDTNRPEYVRRAGVMNTENEGEKRRETCVIEEHTSGACKEEGLSCFSMRIDKHRSRISKPKF